MLRATRPISRSMFAALLTLVLMLPGLAAAQPTSLDGSRPTGLAMLADAALARPVLIGATGLGLATWVATWPFSVLGGNVGEAGRMLVLTPAQSAFWRCLGCTPVQDERNRAERRTRKLAKQQAED